MLQTVIVDVANTAIAFTAAKQWILGSLFIAPADFALDLL